MRYTQLFDDDVEPCGQLRATADEYEGSGLGVGDLLGDRS